SKARRFAHRALRCYPADSEGCLCGGGRRRPSPDLRQRNHQRMATVRIPQPLRNLTGDKSTVDADGDTLSALIANLEATYPGIRERLLDDSGELRRFVNIYVNGDDVRFMDGLNTAIKAGDEVSIVPAVAGG